MNLRKFIRETINEAYNKKVVQYSAVVIEDPLEEQKIKDLAAQYVPEGWMTPPHYHMTIASGPFPKSLKIKGDLNQEVELTLNVIGQSEKSIAFGTFGYYSRNDMPHITIAFNQAAGGAPADSKEIKEWKPIDKVKVKGVIREIGEKNVVFKSEEDSKDEITIDFSENFSQNIMLGNKVIGVTNLYKSKRDGQYVILNKIEILPEYRGLGYANKAMQKVIEYANKNNFIIALTPDSYKGSSVSRLIKWYKSLGFIMNKGKNKDFGHQQLMYKFPDKLDEMKWNKTVITTPSREAHPGIPSEFPRPNDYDQFGNKINDISV